MKAPRIIFAQREVVCSLSVHEIHHKGIWHGWLCTAFFDYEIYPPVKFQVINLSIFGLMLRTRKHKYEK